MHKIPITKLKKGIKARVVEIAATKAVALRLSGLGIRIGASIIKFSAFALRGPVTVKLGSTTIALSHSMAEKIIVEA